MVIAPFPTRRGSWEAQCRFLSTSSVSSSRSNRRSTPTTRSSHSRCAPRTPAIHYKRRVVEAAIGFLIGVGLLLAGVISKIIPVGVGGFLVMLACAMWALTSWRHMGGIVSGRGVARSQDAPQGMREARGMRKGRRRGRRDKSTEAQLHGAARGAVAPPPGGRALAPVEGLSVLVGLRPTSPGTGLAILPGGPSPRNPRDWWLRSAG